MEKNLEVSEHNFTEGKAIIIYAALSSV